MSEKYKPKWRKAKIRLKTFKYKKMKSIPIWGALARLKRAAAEGVVSKLHVPLPFSSYFSHFKTQIDSLCVRKLIRIVFYKCKMHSRTCLASLWVFVQSLFIFLRLLISLNSLAWFFDISISLSLSFSYLYNSSTFFDLILKMYLNCTNHVSLYALLQYHKISIIKG